MPATTAAIYATLASTSDLLYESIVALSERGELLRRIEPKSLELAERGRELSDASVRLERRRRCTLCCVVSVALCACFLMFTAASYIVERA